MNTMLSHTQIICIGIIASLAAGLATSAGAIPIFFTRNISRKLMDALLGMAAGIMLAATAFSLIIPAIEKGGGGIKGAGITLIGILVGGIFLDVVDCLFPDTNLLSNSMNDAENENGAALRRVWLFVIAITVHNFPEGMAVGVGFGDGDIANGISLAIAIGLQNIPEGLAVALPLLQHGYSTGTGVKHEFKMSNKSGLEGHRK